MGIEDAIRKWQTEEASDPVVTVQQVDCPDCMALLEITVRKSGKIEVRHLEHR